MLKMPTLEGSPILGRGEDDKHGHTYANKLILRRELDPVEESCWVAGRGEGAFTWCSLSERVQRWWHVCRDLGLDW